MHHTFLQNQLQLHLFRKHSNIQLKVCLYYLIFHYLYTFHTISMIKMKLESIVLGRGQNIKVNFEVSNNIIICFLFI